MNTCLALLNLGGGELVLIFVVILILFGAKKIPEFAKGLGQGIREFKKASNDVTNEFHNAMNQEPAPSSPPAVKAPEKNAVASEKAATPADTVSKS